MKTNFRRGFTLIEISIVLVIIGIILASVMKGRELIKSSQIKEYNQVFVSEWETIANSYFSRMAANIADSSAHGGLTASGGIDGFSDGRDLSTSAGGLVVSTVLQSAGINPCDLIKTDITETSDYGCNGTATSGLNPYERTVDGEHIGKISTQISFTNFIIDGKRKNVLLFENIPADVGQAIDTIRDGQPDGEKGSVRAYDPTATNIALPSADAILTVNSWDGDAVYSFDMIIILEH